MTDMITEMMTDIITDPLDFAEIIENDLGKCFSIGPNDRIHCPPDSSLIRGVKQVRKITFLNGYLYCNKKSKDILEKINVTLVECDNKKHFPNSRLRYRLTEQQNLSQYLLILRYLYS